MKVKLKVVGGKNDGKELAIKGTKFLIGRDEDCQLRANSDSISRRHCVVLLDDSRVAIKDMESRNGTFVNGERISGQRRLKSGDRLKVGVLEFEVLIDHSLGGNKRPKVQGVSDVAERTSSRSDSVVDDDVSRWLEEGDEVERVTRLSNPDTGEFKVSKTDSGQIKVVEAEDDKKKKKPEKKPPGKLPPPPEHTAQSSQEAANRMLRKFFKGGN